MRPTKLEWSTVQIWQRDRAVRLAVGRRALSFRMVSSKGSHVHVVVVRGVAGVAVHGAGVDDGEVELLVGGLELHHEVEHLVHHFLGAGCRGGRSC